LAKARAVDPVVPARRHRSLPSLPLAVKIERFTRGAIPVEEWVTGRPQWGGSE